MGKRNKPKQASCHCVENMISWADGKIWTNHKGDECLICGGKIKLPPDKNPSK